MDGLNVDKLSFDYYPSQYLREPGKLCDDEFFRTLKPVVIGRMLQLCDQMRGYAISANQVGIPYQFFVIKRIPQFPKLIPQLWCNPKIIASSGSVLMKESCLSIPGLLVSLRRDESVTVSFKDGATGRDETLVCRGLLSRVVQHEIDHAVHGKLFTDRLTGLNKRDADKYLARMAINTLPAI